mmetsp:Transcript_91983/g.159581  ORF Transcript_91983/g.159581 Transcript_91983/m.159581 type:complete len:299 (-) Transcript_91983:3-899(-)
MGRLDRQEQFLELRPHLLDSLLLLLLLLPLCLVLGPQAAFQPILPQLLHDSGLRTCLLLLRLLPFILLLHDLLLASVLQDLLGRLPKLAALLVQIQLLLPLDFGLGVPLCLELGLELLCLRLLLLLRQRGLRDNGLWGHLPRLINVHVIPVLSEPIDGRLQRCAPTLDKGLLRTDLREPHVLQLLQELSVDLGCLGRRLLRPRSCLPKRDIPRLQGLEVIVPWVALGVELLLLFGVTGLATCGALHRDVDLGGFGEIRVARDLRVLLHCVQVFELRPATTYKGLCRHCDRCPAHTKSV